MYAIVSERTWDVPYSCALCSPRGGPSITKKDKTDPPLAETCKNVETRSFVDQLVPFIFKRYFTTPRALRGPKLSQTIIWLGASKTTRSRSRVQLAPGETPHHDIASD